MFLKYSLFTLLIVLLFNQTDSSLVDTILTQNVAQTMEALKFTKITIIHNKKISLFQLLKHFSRDNNFFTSVRKLENLDAKEQQAEINLVLPESEENACDVNALLKLLEMDNLPFTTICFGNDIDEFEKISLEKIKFTAGFWFAEMKSGKLFHIQLLHGLFVKNEINVGAVSRKEPKIDQKGAVLKSLCLSYPPWATIGKCDENYKNCEGKKNSYFMQ